ncbi:MAG: citrate transporter [Lachnospiraceae bacterium]|nr:citrate transporter [Lachnospiraceae bacterium]
MVAQIVAVTIFIFMFAMIVLDKIERHYVTLGCGALTLILVFGLCMHSLTAIWETVNLRAIFSLDFWYQAGESVESGSGINWATVIFIAGMMVMVEGMAHVGFFRWLCMRIAKLVHYKTVPIFITFMIMSAVLAMFIDSITVILFLAAVTVELAGLLKFTPIPMILAEIFCANLGGSATMCGDPPNIIIGTSLHYSFLDFITNTGLIAGMALIVVVLYFYFVFRKELKKKTGEITENLEHLDPGKSITDKKGFVISCVIFLCAIVLLITHAQTGLTVAFIGLFIAIVTLLASGKAALSLIKKVDYKTLLFFVGLFIVVGGLEETGILEVIAKFIGNVSGGNMYLMVGIILWISAIASAVVDNIPFAATMIPVIRTLAQTQGMDLSVLAWTMALGTDIGGSATPIGASANVVGIAVAEKDGHHIGWGKYCKAVMPVTVLVLAIATAIIFVRYL